jgi:cytochrome P450
LDTDFLTTQLLADLRDKYRSEAVWIQVLGERSLVVFGVAALREVLDNSGTVYASDPKAKLQGMSHFQPGALTISRGEAWRKRRDFVEEALATPRRVHPLAEGFLSIVGEEVAVLKERSTAFILDWPEFERTTERIALQVIFGQKAREDHVLAGRLRRMMAEANRVVGLRKSRQFDRYYRDVEKYVEVRELGSLVSQLPDVSGVDSLSQVTHWLFAMSGTLAANTFRALAAISAQPKVEKEVRRELASMSTVESSGVDGLRYLEGCVQETMRLWPTTSMFGRQTSEPATLAGVRLPAGTQVLIVNTFNHRDPRSVEDPDGFKPDRWLGADYRFNHFSNGTQGCPGAGIALFLAKAMLANLLSDTRFVDQGPPPAPGPVAPEGKLGMAVLAGTAATNMATLPARLFASSRFTSRQLEAIAYSPKVAVPQLTALLKTIPRTMTFGDHRAGRYRVDPGKPMPSVLNYFTLKLAMEPRPH